MPGVNLLIQINDPALWKLIRKAYYPTLLDKIIIFLTGKKN